MGISKLFLLMASIGYGIACVIYLESFLKKKNIRNVAGLVTLFLSFSIHSTDLILRGLEINMLPVFSFSDALSFFAWTIIFVYLLISLRLAIRNFPLLLVPFSFLFTIVAFFNLQEGSHVAISAPLFPFVLHVICAFFAYGAFSLAFASGSFYLLQDRELKRKRPGLFYYQIADLHVLEKFVYRAILFGLILLTISLVIGFVLVRQYIQTDKTIDATTIISLLLWCFYATVLYLHHWHQWRGRKVVLFSTLSFVLVLLTFGGVQIFGSSIHLF